MNNNIVKGYHGIMDLDLSGIDPKFHKELIQQHHEDIEEYKLEQKARPSRLRYENAIVRALTVRDIENKAVTKRKKEADELWYKEYERRVELYYKVHEKKEHNN